MVWPTWRLVSPLSPVAPRLGARFLCRSRRSTTWLPTGGERKGLLLLLPPPLLLLPPPLLLMPPLLLLLLHLLLLPLVVLLHLLLLLLLHLLVLHLLVLLLLHLLPPLVLLLHLLVLLLVLRVVRLFRAVLLFRRERFWCCVHFCFQPAGVKSGYLVRAPVLSSCILLLDRTVLLACLAMPMDPMCVCTSW